MAAETITKTNPAEAAPAAAADLDAKAWESITGEKPESPEIETPNFAKLEADGKLEGGTPRGPDGKFAPKAKPEEADESEDEAKETKGEKPKPETKKPETKKPEAKPAKTDKKDDKPPDRDTRRKILAAKEIVGRVLKYNDDDVDAMPPEKLLDLAQRVKGTYEAFERLKEDHRALKEKARDHAMGRSLFARNKPQTTAADVPRTRMMTPSPYPLSGKKAAATNCYAITWTPIPSNRCNGRSTQSALGSRIKSPKQRNGPSLRNRGLSWTVSRWRVRGWPRSFLS